MYFKNSHHIIACLPSACETHNRLGLPVNDVIRQVLGTDNILQFQLRKSRTSDDFLSRDSVMIHRDKPQSIIIG